MKLNDIYFYDDGCLLNPRFIGYVKLDLHSIELLEAKVKQIKAECNILMKNKEL